ncbi:unnamed protein product [Cyclocybe aegerita]|uniref:Amidohydrolase-related domain-containing protein n=1 Tax=Cyclocybe aegerita TaxID=1973307 RepID=A0A8S0VR93_CYCAE|nr:unnamed protein product [Cyclocybe aegerita]
MVLVSAYFSFVASLSTVPLALAAAKWRYNGTGSIVVGEEWTVPELLYQISPVVVSPFPGGTHAELVSNLLDVHNQRLDMMDANQIDFMVLGCNSPCIQGITDPVTAANTSVYVNNQLAASISNNTERFGGFASLAMHNASFAALELKRAVKELGLLGAMIHGYQQSGPDGQTFLYYDQPEYDVFWKMVSDLDVPVYLHTRLDAQPILDLLYAHAPFLRGAPQGFSAGAAAHVLGLCVNGIFDRFPDVRLIVGHMGERIPSDLYRIDTEFSHTKTAMKENITTYFKTNMYKTTSSDFSTSLLKFHTGEIGLDRIMYSTDYPKAYPPDGTAWLNSLRTALSKHELASLKREVAIKVLRLNN